MRYLAIFLLFVSTFAIGNDYYNPQINTYDSSSGLYYKAITDTTGDGGFLSSKTASNAVININVFDPSTGKSSLIFKESQKRGIAVVLFESGYKDGSVEFLGATQSSIVLNNSRVERREPRDKLLIVVRDPEAKVSTLYTSDKRGGGLKPLATVLPSATWHIDVRNSKLRVVRQVEAKLAIESYDW